MGRFCYICQRLRANERFSSRGHRDHVCKDCARLPRETRREFEILSELERMLHQSHISAKNQSRLLSLTQHPAPKVVRTATVLLELARHYSFRRRRLVRLRRNPDQLRRLITELPAGMWEGYVGQYGDSLEDPGELLPRFDSGLPDQPPGKSRPRPRTRRAHLLGRLRTWGVGLVPGFVEVAKYLCDLGTDRGLSTQAFGTASKACPNRPRSPARSPNSDAPASAVRNSPQSNRCRCPSPRINSANARAVSVFPTPVGLAKIRQRSRPRDGTAPSSRRWTAAQKPIDGIGLAAHAASETPWKLTKSINVCWQGGSEATGHRVDPGGSTVSIPCPARPGCNPRSEPRPSGPDSTSNPVLYSRAQAPPRSPTGNHPESAPACSPFGSGASVAGAPDRTARSISSAATATSR